jgi:hypothetical protein
MVSIQLLLSPIYKDGKLIDTEYSYLHFYSQIL